MFEVQGKVALVTGAASGIGLASAKELLRNKAKSVALVDINAENGQKALDEITREFGAKSAIFIKSDVSDNNQIEEAFDTTVKAFNQLDIVINNAGIVQELQWQKCVAVNLMAVITGCTLALEKYLPEYQSERGSVIVNMASAIALHPIEAMPIYCATKSGVLSYTRAMGGDFRYQKTGIRICAICPSLVDTPILNMNENQVAEPYLSMLLNGCKLKAVRQTPEDLAKKVMKVIREAPTGSVWLAVGQSCTKLDFLNAV